MLSSLFGWARAGLFLSIAFALNGAAEAGELVRPEARPPRVAEASNEGELAMKAFTLQPGFDVEMFAAEPHLANPVAFTIDHQGRFFVAETFRLHAGVTDIRGHMDWLDEDLAARTVEDRVALLKRHEGEKFLEYEQYSERVKLLLDTNRDGEVEESKVFAEGFNTAADGIGSGVLVRGDDVYFANIPNLWLLKDTDDDGVADQRRSLHYGYGVRVGFLGHDLHGLILGPDGKLYYTIGDRGSSIEVDGRRVGDPDSGTVFRCNLDGSDLEVFASGLRNPQELAFDQYGNLFTGDNNSDGGDRARIVYVVDGGDSGWRIGYQFIQRPNARGPWNAERMWHPQWEGQAAYIVPPLTNITDGPSGFAFYPGTGLPAKYNEHFFLVDFHGGRSSGIHSFTVEPNGAGFALAQHERFLWDALPTDVAFGIEPGIYLSDWVQGWGMTGKGRIYRVFHPEAAEERLAVETGKLLTEGMKARSGRELERLLGHADMRVRQEAQFELAVRGPESLRALFRVARRADSTLPRLHAIWGIGQVLRVLSDEQKSGVGAELASMLGDKDTEVRAQVAKVAGEERIEGVFDDLLAAVKDEQPRVRFFAAQALGRLENREAVPALLHLLRENANQDPYLRHAASLALARIGDMDALAKAAGDESAGVRMGVVLAMRRLGRGEVAHFLNDKDPLIVVEAARAINDLPITSAMRELAALEKNLSGVAGHDRPELLRRVVNANYRYGTRESAQALGRLAANDNIPEFIRAEALNHLANWQHPSGRDQVTGMWRPVVGDRNEAHAAQALEPQLQNLLGQASDQVRIAAIRAAADLQIRSAVNRVAELARDANAAGGVRVAALRALADLDQAQLSQALKLALADSSEELRKEALRLQSRLAPAAALGQIRATLGTGTIGEKQSALGTLGNLNEPGVDELLAQWLDALLAGKVELPLQADLLAAAEKRESPELKRRLEAYEAQLASAGDLAPFRVALAGGDAEEGRKIFFEHTAASCLRCHKVDGTGGEVGPDLTGIASRVDREHLLESLVLPNKTIAEGFESITVTTRDGLSYAGVTRGETETELTLNSPEDGIMTIKKSEITGRRQGLSAMPEGLPLMLTKTEIRDLVEYLASLK